MMIEKSSAVLCSTVLRRFALWTLTLLSLTALTGSVQAACGLSDRVPSSCFTAKWKNYGVASTLEAKSHCSQHGTVVVKWDVDHGRDHTWYLHGGGTRKGSIAGRVKGAYCCRDLGICSSRDVPTVEACKKKFKLSQAGVHCTLYGVVTSQTQCRFAARCVSPTDSRLNTSVVVSSYLTEATSLRFCGGRVKFLRANRCKA